MEIKRNPKVDAIKMILKKYTLDIDLQPNLSSDSCRELIAQDIVKFIEDNEKSLNDMVVESLEV